MERVPDIPRCFGIFPPKVATYFIALFGLGSGGFGLTGLVMYSLVEDSEVAKFFSNKPVDPDVKKLVLLTLGLSSLLLSIASVLLLMGILCKLPGVLSVGAWFLFTLCSILIFGAICMPMLCFFYAETCVIKKVSSSLLTFGYMFVTFFLWIWLYFMAVVFNYILELPK